MLKGRKKCDVEAYVTAYSLPDKNSHVLRLKKMSTKFNCIFGQGLEHVIWCIYMSRGSPHARAWFVWGTNN